MQRVQKNFNFFKRTKVKKNIFKLQNMNIYCKNCKNPTECTHPKKLVLMSDKKAKSKCAKCLTGRTFLDKINNEYDLEQLVKLFFLY